MINNTSPLSALFINFSIPAHLFYMLSHCENYCTCIFTVPYFRTHEVFPSLLDCASACFLTVPQAPLLVFLFRACITVSGPVLRSPYLYACFRTCIPVSVPVFLFLYQYSCSITCVPVSIPVWLFEEVCCCVFRRLGVLRHSSILKQANHLSDTCQVARENHLNPVINTYVFLCISMVIDLFPTDSRHLSNISI